MSTCLTTPAQALLNKARAPLALALSFSGRICLRIRWIRDFPEGLMIAPSFARLAAFFLRRLPTRSGAYGPPAEYYRLENDFIRHCKYLASRYRDAADENLAVAKVHREAAAGAKD